MDTHFRVQYGQKHDKGGHFEVLNEKNVTRLFHHLDPGTWNILSVFGLKLQGINTIINFANRPTNNTTINGLIVLHFIF